MSINFVDQANALTTTLSRHPGREVGSRSTGLLRHTAIAGRFPAGGAAEYQPRAFTPAFYICHQVRAGSIIICDQPGRTGRRFMYKNCYNVKAQYRMYISTKQIRRSLSVTDMCVTPYLPPFIYLGLHGRSIAFNISLQLKAIYTSKCYNCPRIKCHLFQTLSPPTPASFLSSKYNFVLFQRTQKSTIALTDSTLMYYTLDGVIWPSTIRSAACLMAEHSFCTRLKSHNRLRRYAVMHLTLCRCNQTALNTTILFQKWTQRYWQDTVDLSWLPNCEKN